MRVVAANAGESLSFLEAAAGHQTHRSESSAPFVLQFRGG